MAQTFKNLPALRETQVQSWGLEDLLEEGMETHSSILAWRIPWTEEPDGLSSMGTMVHAVVRNQRQGDWVTNIFTFTFQASPHPMISKELSSSRQDMSTGSPRERCFSEWGERQCWVVHLASSKTSDKLWGLEAQSNPLGEKMTKPKHFYKSSVCSQERFYFPQMVLGSKADIP